MTEKPISRLVVLVSGNGSNLQAILDACINRSLSARVVAVISNKADAFALQRAKLASIPVEVFIKFKEQNRHEYDRGLADLVASYHPDWVILAGWMRLLSAPFLDRFPDHVVNLHPALPGTFPGTDAIIRAFEAYQRKEIQYTGVMVHLVPDEGVDNGPLLAQEMVPIYPDDTLEMLEKRVHSVEHRLLVETIRNLVQ